jgi:flagellar hook assembly protein FlgD
MTLVGAFVVPAAQPAAATVGPGTTPTLTAPADGAQVAGDVTLTATTTAASVQFLVDGNPLGSEVAAVAGTATTSWPTWGFGNGNSGTVQAADCDITGCSPPTAAHTVTVMNAAPALTNPTDGETTGTATTMTATAGGGGIEFIVDGDFAHVAHFAGSAPYEFHATGLAEGSHTAQLVSCDAADTVCDGPMSPLISFTVEVLHPSVTTVSPSPFSPNGDGRRDTTATTFTLPDSETVSYQVLNNSDQVVRGPVSFGTLASGTHAYAWNGRNNAGVRVPDGTYTVELDSSVALGGSEVARGTTTHDVVVDDTAPTLTSLTNAGASFYPYPDGYADTWTPGITLGGGPATVFLDIVNHSGVVIRRLSSGVKPSGRIGLAWNGRAANNSIVPAGTYTFRYWAQDVAGNQHYTAYNFVHVGAQRLINKSAVLSFTGHAAQLETTDTSCTGYSYSLSEFPTGVWLVNTCPDLELVLAYYSATLPAAVRYTGFAVKTYGDTFDAPEEVNAAILNYKTAEWEPGGLHTVNTPAGAHAWTSLGTFATANRVSNRHIQVGFILPSFKDTVDYDLDVMDVTVTYQVLG